VRTWGQTSVGLIAEMVGVAPEAMERQTTPQTTIEFQSLDQFHAVLIAFVVEQQQKYRAAAVALLNRNLLSLADTQPSLPELELIWRDMARAWAGLAERLLHARVEVVGTAALLEASRDLFGAEFRFGHCRSRSCFRVGK